MRKILLLGCASLISYCVQAQVDVDPLTGRLQANVQLYTVTQGSLSVPITLVYQGGGVKVEQSEGSAGMGWELSAGGGVFRELRGLPDDLNETTGDQRKGWLASGIASGIQSFTPGTDDNPSTCTDERNDYNFLQSQLYFKDTEPDIFSFSAPGLSGRFVFDASGNIQPMPYQDISITPSYSGAKILSFTIKNNTGITYTFAANETVTRSTTATTLPTQLATTYYQFRNPLSFEVAWRLTQMSTVSGDVILFSYSGNDTEHSQTDISIVQTTGTETKLYDIQDDVTTRQLNTIISNLQIITINWTDNLVTGLNEMRLLSSHNTSFAFEYAYADDAVASNQYFLVRKPFLKKVTELHDCISFPSYEFDYNGLTTPDGGQTYNVQLGFYDRKKQDLWGYFNNTSTTNIPDIYYDGAANDGERFRAVPKASESPTYMGASRFVNDTYVARGSLQNIKYPQGGTQKIFYESNQYYDSAAAVSKKGAGVRVSSIQTIGVARGSSNMTTYYQYLRGDGVNSSGRLTYPPSYAFPDGSTILRTTRHMGPESSVMYERTTVSQTGQGKTVYTFLLPGMYPYTTASGWSATKNHVSRYVDPQVPGDPPPSCFSIGNLVNGYYAFPWTANQYFDHERGLPLRFQQYDESGLKLLEKKFDYQALSPGSVNIKGVKAEPMTNGTFVFGNYSLVTNTGKVTLTETVRVTDEVTPGGTLASPANFVETITSYTYNSVHKLLEQVDVTNSDNIILRSKYKYAKDFATITNPEPTDLAAVAIKALNDTRRHATMLQSTQSSVTGGTPTVIDASLLLFRDFGTGKVLPYKTLAYPRKAGYTEASVGTNGSGKHVLNYNTDHYGTEILSYAGTNPVATIDFRNKKSGAHYGYSNTIPVAVFTNALPEEVVYDGFETTTGYEMFQPTIVSGDFAGTKAGSWAAAGYKNKDNIKKGSSKYRASVWVKAATTTTITFKAIDNVTLIDQKSVTTTAADVNKWTYVEAFLNTTTAPAPPGVFKFQLHSSAVALVDEVVFLPAEAEIASMSYDAMLGKTAELDGKGNAIFRTYDAMGRPQYLLNKDKDVLQLDEYRYESDITVPVNSSFTVNTAEYNFKTGTALTFTAGSNCQPVATYAWKVNGTAIGTNSSTAQYTATASGPITVELRVTLNNGTYSKTSAYYCVAPAPLGYTMGLVDLDNKTPVNQYNQCNFSKRFTAIAPGTPSGCGSSNITYSWSYMREDQGFWTPITASTNQIDFIQFFNNSGYTMKCTITQTCAPAAYPCEAGSTSLVQEITSFISFINKPICQ